MLRGKNAKIAAILGFVMVAGLAFGELNPPTWIHGTWRQESNQTHLWVFGDGTARESYRRDDRERRHMYHDYPAVTNSRPAWDIYVLTWNAPSAVYKHTFRRRSVDVVVLTEEWTGGKVRTLHRSITAEETPAASRSKDYRIYSREEIEDGTSWVGIICRDKIERMAKYAHRWTDGLLGSKFTHFNTKQTSEGYARYHGDKVQFQNGFGAWQNMKYWCDVDLDAEKVIQVNVTPGRL